MKPVLLAPFKPLTLLLSGVGSIVVGSWLANQAFDSNDPRTSIGGYLILAGILLGVLSLSIVLFRTIRRLGTNRLKDSGSVQPGAKLVIAADIAVAALIVAALASFAVIVGPFVDTRTLSQADPAMLALADAAGMSREGKLIFLRTNPQLVSDTQMESACAENTAANNSNGFIEQGCYVPAENKIYLRQMPPELHDLVVATAAYEMLHPVYIAVHSSRGTELDQAIETNFTAINDANLNEQVANFAKTEPSARDLELFSLLGTGYTDLSGNLSQFYAPYFTDISLAVNANNQVRQLFKSSELTLTQLNAQIKREDTLASSAYASSVRWADAGSQYWDDYYYQQYVQYLNQENALISQYNDQLKGYNALVTEFNGTQPVQHINPAQTQSL